MSSASIKKIISCKKKQLIDLVLDIEKYPEFVPWCLDGKIHEKKESNDLIEIKADLKVGKKIINETYSSLVLYYKEKDKILVTNIDGPLTHLKNEWNFKEINNSTQLEFEIDFEIDFEKELEREFEIEFEKEFEIEFEIKGFSKEQ